MTNIGIVPASARPDGVSLDIQTGKNGAPSLFSTLFFPCYFSTAR